MTACSSTTSCSGSNGDAVRGPAYRDAKVHTLLETAAEVLGPSREALALDLVDDLGRERRHLAVVLVSDNPYALDDPLAPAPARRPAAARSASSSSTRPATARAVQDEPGAPRLEVTAPEPVHAGVDGEAADLSPTAAVRYPAGGAVGPDLLAPPVRLAISASPPPWSPTRVMAHFLGIAAAYEALHVHPDLHVCLLVTLGSPLALSAPSKMVTTVIAGVAQER